MREDPAVARVRTGALVLMLAVAAEMIRYAYVSFERALTFSFWEPERWNTHRLVDPGTVIEFGPRLGYFTIWATIIVLSLLAFLAGLQLLNRVRRGKIFELRAAQAVTRLGLILGTAMVADLIYHALDPWLLTRFNDDPHPIRWGYDPSDIKTLSMATILFLFGWVMQKSVEIDQENRQFV